MKAQSKTARLQAAAPAEASPHVRRATSFYQRPKRTRPVRTAEPTTAGRRNQTVRMCRFEPYGGPKRGGAKYGPRPKGVGVGGQAEPMRAARRLRVYTDHNRDRGCGWGFLTRRQCRQIERMARRHGEPAWAAPTGSGRGYTLPAGVPTAKQVRRG